MELMTVRELCGVTDGARSEEIARLSARWGIDMRTSCLPQGARGQLGWGQDGAHPREMRLRDEAERDGDRDGKTAVRTDGVDLGHLDKSIFTKTWLEAQSR